MNLKKLRQKALLTQNELSRLIGVSQSEISQWESGKRYPRAALLPRIADTLGCTVDELLRS